MAVTRIAEGLWRAGSALVNFYVVQDGAHLTVVDAGLRRQRPQLDQVVAEAGRALGAVSAVVLTHGHPDHLGFAESLRTEAGVPVLVHEADAVMARTLRTGPRDGSVLPYLRRPAVARFLAEIIASGRPVGVRELVTFSDGERLDVPGRPLVIHAPGHTPGCVALHFEDHGALLVGDVLCAYNPLTGRRGPQLLPSAANASTAQALASLARLEGIEADVVAFGHGDPWRQGVAGALNQARALGPT